VCCLRTVCLWSRARTLARSLARYGLCRSRRRTLQRLPAAVSQSVSPVLVVCFIACSLHEQSVTQKRVLVDYSAKPHAASKLNQTNACSIERLQNSVLSWALVGVGGNGFVSVRRWELRLRAGNPNSLGGANTHPARVSGESETSRRG